MKAVTQNCKNQLIMISLLALAGLALEGCSSGVEFTTASGPVLNRRIFGFGSMGNGLGDGNDNTDGGPGDPGDSGGGGSGDPSSGSQGPGDPSGRFLRFRKICSIQRTGEAGGSVVDAAAAPRGNGEGLKVHVYHLTPINPANINDGFNMATEVSVTDDAYKLNVVDDIITAGRISYSRMGLDRSALVDGYYTAYICLGSYTSTCGQLGQLPSLIDRDPWAWNDLSIPGGAAANTPKGILNNGLSSYSSVATGLVLFQVYHDAGQRQVRAFSGTNRGSASPRINFTETTSPSIEIIYKHISSGYGGDSECDDTQSPLIVDTTGNGIALSSRPAGVAFKIAGELGAEEQISWPTSADDMFLALPQNGQITSAQQLFGNNTVINGQKSANGFLALEKYDSSYFWVKDYSRFGVARGAPVIDSNDSIFSQLRLWSDVRPRNGRVDPGELFTLESKAVDAISLDYLPMLEVDFYGNETLQRSLTLYSNRSPTAIVDLWFSLTSH